MDNRKILIVIPTSARRLILLNQAICSIVNQNEDYNFDTVVIKNGTFSEEAYSNFQFDCNVIKEHSSPGGNIARAVNVGLGYNDVERYKYVIVTEDDIVITEAKNWLDKVLFIYEHINNLGFLGNRIHGKLGWNQRGAFNMSVWSKKLFEAFWVDGFLICKAETIMKYRWDETEVSGGDWAEVQLRMREDGLVPYYLYIDMKHHQILGDEKFRYCEEKIHSDFGPWELYNKFKDSPNLIVREFAELDLKVNWLRYCEGQKNG